MFTVRFLLWKSSWQDTGTSSQGVRGLPGIRPTLKFDISFSFHPVNVKRILIDSLACQLSIGYRFIVSKWFKRPPEIENRQDLWTTIFTFSPLSETDISAGSNRIRTGIAPIHSPLPPPSNETRIVSVNTRNGPLSGRRKRDPVTHTTRKLPVSAECRCHDRRSWNRPKSSSTLIYLPGTTLHLDWCWKPCKNREKFQFCPSTPSSGENSNF